MYMSYVRTCTGREVKRIITVIDSRAFLGVFSLKLLSYVSTLNPTRIVRACHVATVVSVPERFNRQWAERKNKTRCVCGGE